MVKYVKTDVNNLVRDMESRAVVSVDKTSLQAYRKQRKLRSEQEQRLATIENELSDIKSLLTNLVSMLNGSRDASKED